MWTSLYLFKREFFFSVFLWNGSTLFWISFVSRAKENGPYLFYRLLFCQTWNLNTISNVSISNKIYFEIFVFYLNLNVITNVSIKYISKWFLCTLNLKLITEIETNFPSFWNIYSFHKLLIYYATIVESFFNSIYLDALWQKYWKTVTRLNKCLFFF